MRTVTLPLLVLMMALSIGCNNSKERFIYSRPFDKPKDDLVKQTLEVLDTEENKLEKAEVEKGRYECKWKERFHDFRYEGYRTKSIAVIEPADEDDDVPVKKGAAAAATPPAVKYKIGICVKKERNDAMENPSDPNNADWSHVGFDEDAENIFMYKILSRLEPLTVGDDFDRRMKERQETIDQVDQMFDKAKVGSKGAAELDLSKMKTREEGTDKEPAGK